MELNELGIRYGTSDVDLYNKMIQLDFVEVYFDHLTKSFVQGTSTRNVVRISYLLRSHGLALSSLYFI